MWAVIAAIAFAVALVLQLAKVSRPPVLTPTTFALAGLLALALAHFGPGWPWGGSHQ